MAEIIYRYPSMSVKSNADINANIRWLTEEDYEVFIRHLTLCGQKLISEDIWQKIYSAETMYCGLFINGEMVARSCREIISPDQWEIADVRVAKEYRNQGYGYQVCSFVLSFVLQEGKRASIRTEEDNFAMQKVIKKLGFIQRIE